MAATDARALALLGVLLVAGLWFAAEPSRAQGAPCPVPSPLRILQDDAGSGRDAGDRAEAAVPVPGPGWHYASLTIPFENGLDDLHDWFVLDVPPGPRTVTFDLQNVPNILLGMGNTVPLIYYFEVWREGEPSPTLEFASWAPPQSVTAEGERLWVHVYPSPLLLWDLCAGTGDWPAYLGLLPGPLQTYGFLVACAPHCW